MYIAVFYIIIVLGLAALAGVFWIDRNWFKRYQREEFVRVVTVLGTDFVFAEEENWQEQDVVVRVG